MLAWNVVCARTKNINENGGHYCIVFRASKNVIFAVWKTESSLTELYSQL
jgi:hypothetical protein